MKILLIIIALVTVAFLVLQHWGRNTHESMQIPAVANYLQGALRPAFELKRLSAPCFDRGSGIFRLAPGQRCPVAIGPGKSEHADLRLSLLDPSFATAELISDENSAATLADQSLRLQRSQEASVIVSRGGGKLTLTCPPAMSECVIGIR